MVTSFIDTQDAVEHWARAVPVPDGCGLDHDLAQLREWICWVQPLLLNRLQGVEDGERRRQRGIQRRIAEARAACVAAHRASIFDGLTQAGRTPMRIEDIVEKIPVLYPGLLPTDEELAQDAGASLADKCGHELSSALVVSALLDDPDIGRTLAQWMRDPLADSCRRLDAFVREGVLDLSCVNMRRSGRVACIEMRTPRALNSEDEALNTALETAADIALMDPQTDVIVLRGGVVENAKYRGQRVFCSGVNLTRLYEGGIPVMFYIAREMGFVSKILRGLNQATSLPSAADTRREKPWVAAVETHAIGGGVQLLLVCDHVIAGQDVLLSIPARAEGFIPGAANLRLPHYMGRRQANRLIYRNAWINVTSEMGRLLVDDVVAPDDMEAGIATAVDDIMQLGVDGMVSNRRAFCVAMETPEQFVAYMSLLAREQALCMYGGDVTRNLQRMWIQRGDRVGSTPASVSS